MISVLLLACALKAWPFDDPEARRQSELNERRLHEEIQEDEAIRTREAVEAISERQEERERREKRRHYHW